MKTIFKSLAGLIYLLCDFGTSMVGYTIHGSIFWSIIDFIISPLVWCKWLAYHEVTLTIIKHTFEFFFQ